MYSESFRLLIVLAMSLIMVSCASKRDDAHDHSHHEPEGEDAVWKEMDDFHMVMAESFHPYKDSADLDPAKTNASELLAAADAWAAAPLPDKVDNDEMKSKLQQLKSQAATFAESVRSANDDVVAEQLTRMHDTFHAIQEAWYGNE